MGAAHSSAPRSVSMGNPAPDFVIDISHDVVKRLKQAKENAKSPVASPIKEAPEVPVAPPPVRQPTDVYKNTPPVTYATPSGHTLSAMEIHPQKEIELQENDAMWRLQVEKLERTLKRTNDFMETEYSSAVEDVRKCFDTASPIQQLPPCQDLKAQVIACYRI